MDAGEEAGPAGGGSNLRSRSGYPCHRPDPLRCVVGRAPVGDRPCSVVSFPSDGLASGQLVGFGVAACRFPVGGVGADRKV
jgi:hypothetical protein